MHGLILNEPGEYFTYPYPILHTIEAEVRKLNWRITNLECGGDLPFAQRDDSFVSGDVLMDTLCAHENVQCWWGAFSGFPKEILWAQIRQNPVCDLKEEQPYLYGTLHHLEPQSVLELIAFDGTETYILTDSDAIAQRLLAAYPRAEKLDKYVCDSPQEAST